MASASLYLPLVSWHHYTNPTTTTLVYRHPYVYAGQKDGHIWVYTLDKASLTLKHKYLFTGHKAAITALCILKSPDADTPSNNNNATEDVLLSADETGEIARWNTMDGRCQAVNPNGFFGTPTQLKVFDKISQHYIFCSGQSNEICILNASNLEVVRVWGGHANWITCTNFYDQYEKKQRLMTATLDGQLDLWDMDVTMPVLYREKKRIKNQPRIDSTWNDGVLDLTSHPNGSLFLMLTRQQAIVFALTSTNQWVPQCTLAATKEWVGGAWAGQDRLVLWASDGKVKDYTISTPHGVSSESMVFEESQVYYSATLSTTYALDDENGIFPDDLVSTLCAHSNDGDVSILTVCNRSNHDSSFTINTLSPPEDTDSEITVTRNKEISFQSIWPIQQPQDQRYGSITTTIPVSSNHLAIGYENGTICIVPLSMALLHLNQLSDPLLLHRQDTRLFEKAHHGKVTCLLIPEHHGSSTPCEQKHLLSGGRDGCVKIWNIINGKFVASFTVHASPVASFVEPAEQNDSKIRGCVVSIAHDNSLALISVDSMTCLYIIPGYTYPLVQIQWRPSEDYVLFAYSDDAVFVWQLKAGHLDRILSGKTSKQVMADSRWPSNRIQSSSRKTNANTNHTVHTKSILSKSQDLYTDKLFAQVFLFNIRRLVFDLKDSGRLPANAYHHHSLNGSATTTTTTTSAPQPVLSSSSTLLPTLSTSSSTRYSPELSDPLDTARDDDMDTTTATTTTSNSKPTHNRKKSGGFNNHNENKEQYLLKKRELVSVVMSIIVSSGAAATSQGPFEKLWPLCHGTGSSGNSGISDGIRGVNGYLSLTAPTPDEKQPWTDSSTLTATRLLSMAFLMKAVDKSGNNEQGTSSLFADYVRDLGHQVGPQYTPPSLSLLSRYWQDAEARSIFSMAMTELDATQLHAFVDYWKNYLPVSSSLEDTDTQMMTRATIVLGIIGCDQPHVLNEQVRKSTALSLTLLLSDTTLDDMMDQDNSTQQDSSVTANKTIDSVTLTRILSSMELLGQGFTTWEVYINASNVLRTLFAYANQKDPAPTTTSNTSRQAIRQGANHAIFTIAKNNHMPLVIGTLTFDSTHAKKIDHRLGCLKIISTFIRKNPLLLYGHVYRVIEAVVKTLDPNVPHMRESMLVAATATLHDLVNRYSSVDFSSSAQKLVVGTLEGATIVYDLQTATRSAVFEGHTGAVSVVKFSPDAKWIATGSLLDHTVRVWHSQLSLLGMFTHSLTQRRQTNENTGSGSGSHSTSTTASGSQKPYKVFSFALPENSQVDPDSMQFEWPSNRCVKLRINDIVMSFNV
ncbi:hypothetical protein BCR42DRAFT_421704 [Absidia repens]|uniref:WD40-repeat-containing domain protein n=1 Tax=Absidia repens TaxID=90262 RepID=A0A1X2I806_9FUNG|nr:hypothetical protein BCR42DRAFT_421704 [Absidia repens]